MNKHTLMAIVATATFASAGLVRADDDDKPVNLSETSPAVQAAVAKAAEGGKLDSVAKEDEDGTMQYTAVIEKDGQKIEAAIGLDGAFKGTEEDIRMSAVPEAAKAAMKTAAGGGKLSGAEQDTAADGTISYEADVKGGSISEVAVSPDGKVLSTEKAGGEDKEDGDKPDKD